MWQVTESINCVEKRIVRRCLESGEPVAFGVEPPNPKFLAEQSEVSIMEVDEDGYPLRQGAKAPPIADAGPPLAAVSAASETMNGAQESMSSVRLQARAETDEAGESDAAEKLDAAE